jgi:hypothetical protein
MFKQLQSRIGSAWCSLTHTSVTWPIHGHYQCRRCGRRFPAFAEAWNSGRRRRIALQPAVSLLLALFLIPIARPLTAAELQPETLAAWNAYVKKADVDVQEHAAGRQPFLWVDQSPERAARVRHGEVVVAPATGHGAEVVPYGLIHDWIGAIFVPGATRDNYKRMYRPVVTSSKTLACTEDSQEFQMVWQRKVLFVSAAMQGDYQAHDIVLDAHREYSLAEAVEIREIEGHGHPGEHLLPPDTGNGFIWRIRSVARYEERDGGVYLELEAAALTRDIPASVAWFVKPVVNHLSINSLTTTLRQTRDAVIASQHNLQSLASCRLPDQAPNLAKAGGE